MPYKHSWDGKSSMLWHLALMKKEVEVSMCSSSIRTISIATATGQLVAITQI